MDKMPKWADVVLIPLISLILAFVAVRAGRSGHRRKPAARRSSCMVKGALGSTYGWGYTLYYATNFIFTGLAVAVAFHARLFNIGGEGQAAARRPWRGAGLSAAIAVAALDAGAAGRDRWRLRCSARPGR